MEITEIRVYPREEDRLKAFVTVTFDNCFVVRNMKIIQGDKGLMVCMPSRKMPDGTYKDVAHPITNEFRHAIEVQIMQAYQVKLTEKPQEGQKVPALVDHDGAD